jgi:hypothetical protein
MPVYDMATDDSGVCWLISPRLVAPDYTVRPCHVSTEQSILLEPGHASCRPQQATQLPMPLMTSGIGADCWPEAAQDGA